MLVSVPFGIDGRVIQPEIGGKIDDPDPVVLRQDLFHDVLRGAVRQAAEHHIGGACRPVDLLVADQFRQIKADQMRKDFRDLLAGMPVGGHEADLDIRMADEQSHQVAARVAACPQNACLDHLRHCSCPDLSLRPCSRRVLRDCRAVLQAATVNSLRQRNRIASAAPR